MSSLHQFEADVTRGRVADHEAEAQRVWTSVGFCTAWNHRIRWRQVHLPQYPFGSLEHIPTPPAIPQKAVLMGFLYSGAWWGAVCCPGAPYMVCPSSRSGTESTVTSRLSALMELGLLSSVPHLHSYCGLWHPSNLSVEPPGSCPKKIYHRVFPARLKERPPPRCNIMWSTLV